MTTSRSAASSWPKWKATPRGVSPSEAVATGAGSAPAREQQVQHFHVTGQGGRVEERPPARLATEVGIEAPVQQLFHPGDVTGEHLAPDVIVSDRHGRCRLGRPLTDKTGKRHDREHADQERERHPAQPMVQQGA